MKTVTIFAVTVYGPDTTRGRQRPTRTKYYRRETAAQRAAERYRARDPREVHSRIACYPIVVSERIAAELVLGG